MLKRSKRISELDTYLSDEQFYDIKDEQPQLSIESSYWKIPDEDNYITSISVNREQNSQIAVASGSNYNNLFIYDLNVNDMELKHEQTITLPKLQSVKWINYNEEESLLLTGDKNGMSHIISVPDSENDENARIVKRFNHKKQFTNLKIKTQSVKQLSLPNWNNEIFLTLCNENVFVWDLNHRSDLPILKNKNLGINTFDSSLTQNGIIALGGEFGIALNDLRSDESKLFTPNEELESCLNIKWAPYDCNILASSHSDGVIKLWDIRSQGSSFGELKGHNDVISSLEWSEVSSSELYSSSNDGQIVHWDLDFTQDLSDCRLKDEFSLDISIFNEFGTGSGNKRRCGTAIAASKENIVQLATCDGKLLSIDGASCIGVHEKLGIDSFSIDETEFDDFINEFSNELVIDDEYGFKSNGLTLQKNDSENTLISISDDMSTKSIRSFSGSTINSFSDDEYAYFNDKEYQEYNEEEEQEEEAEEERIDFTYQEIKPLNRFQRFATIPQRVIV